MKIAVFLFGTRISPRFDCAPSFLLITTDKNKKIIQREELLIQNKNYLEIINRLKASVVDVVICGGISKYMLEMLKGYDTEVIAWVSGDAQKALDLFLQGKLFSGAILCPGKQIRQWGFCRQGKKRQARNK